MGTNLTQLPICQAINVKLYNTQYIIINIYSHSPIDSSRGHKKRLNVA